MYCFFGDLPHVPDSGEFAYSKYAIGQLRMPLIPVVMHHPWVGIRFFLCVDFWCKFLCVLGISH
jgi:hypothetical protein